LQSSRARFALRGPRHARCRLPQLEVLVIPTAAAWYSLLSLREIFLQISTCSRARVTAEAGGSGLGKPLKIIGKPVRDRIPIGLAAIGPKMLLSPPKSSTSGCSIPRSRTRLRARLACRHRAPRSGT
jgi:hypothetical protein